MQNTAQLISRYDQAQTLQSDKVEGIMTEHESDTKYRVAYDLMHTIARNEKSETVDRKYWITLYAQALTVVTTGEPERALRKGS